MLRLLGMPTASQDMHGTEKHCQCGMGEPLVWAKCRSSPLESSLAAHKKKVLPKEHLNRVAFSALKASRWLTVIRQGMPVLVSRLNLDICNSRILSWRCRNFTV
jgi:hypothetical protein